MLKGGIGIGIGVTEGLKAGAPYANVGICGGFKSTEADFILPPLLSSLGRFLFAALLTRVLCTASSLTVTQRSKREHSESSPYSIPLLSTVCKVSSLLPDRSSHKRGSRTEGHESANQRDIASPSGRPLSLKGR